MVRFGESPFIECSSRGDKRLSAFYARIRWRNNKSIEELYQARKIFSDGSTGLSPKEAKGRLPINIVDCRSFYSQLWNEWFQENPHMLDELSSYNGFSDVFGQTGHACQAEEIYRIIKTYRGESM